LSATLVPASEFGIFSPIPADTILFFPTATKPSVFFFASGFNEGPDSTPSFFITRIFLRWLPAPRHTRVFPPASQTAMFRVRDRSFFFSLLLPHDTWAVLSPPQQTGGIFFFWPASQPGLLATMRSASSKLIGTERALSPKNRLFRPSLRFSNMSPFPLFEDRNSSDGLCSSITPFLLAI